MKRTLLASIAAATMVVAASAQTVSWSAAGDVYTLSLNLPNSTDYNWTNAEMVVLPTSGSIVNTGPNYAFDMVTPGATYVGGPRPALLDGAGRAFADGGSQSLPNNSPAKPTYAGQFDTTKVSVAWFDTNNGNDPDLMGSYTLAQVTLSAGGEAGVVGTAYVYDIPNTTIIALDLAQTLEPAAPSVTISSFASARSHGAQGLQALAIPDVAPFFIESRNVLSNTNIYVVTDGTLPAATATFVLKSNNTGDNINDVTIPSGSVTLSLATTNVANDTLVLAFATTQATRYRLTISEIAGSPIASNNERVFSVLVGDVNANGTVNTLDLGQINSSISTATFVNRRDINLSGTMNTLDLGAANSRIGNTLTGIVFPNP